MIINPLIMLVDDNRMDLFISEKTIKYAGIAERFVICRNGTEAFHYLHNNLHNVELLPDVIFLDLNMPGMNGMEFMKQYELLPETVTNRIKVVILSSSEDDKDKEAIINNKHITNYILKPLSEENLTILKAS